jgi:hypothetical protein
MDGSAGAEFALMPLNKPFRMLIGLRRIWNMLRASEVGGRPLETELQYMRMR